MKSHRTTIVGVLAILISAYCIASQWNTNTAFPHDFHAKLVNLKFNLIHVVSPYVVGLFGGWIGIHAADHRTIEKHVEEHHAAK